MGPSADPIVCWACQFPALAQGRLPVRRRLQTQRGTRMAGASRGESIADGQIGPRPTAHLKRACQSE
jgi:hypothetical protein